MFGATTFSSILQNAFAFLMSTRIFVQIATTIASIFVPEQDQTKALQEAVPPDAPLAEYLCGAGKTKAGKGKEGRMNEFMELIVVIGALAMVLYSMATSISVLDVVMPLSTALLVPAAAIFGEPRYKS